MSKLKLNKSNMEFAVVWLTTWGCLKSESVALDFCIKMHNFYSLVKIIQLITIKMCM